MKISRTITLASFILSIQLSFGASMKTLIIDGQNNHKWQETTPLLQRILEESGLFKVDVATAPEKGKDMSGFKPTFLSYDVVVSNYNGERWSPETEKAFVNYVKAGGGFVCVHAANNSFPDWKEYNEMIGLGGWGGRNEKSGPYIRFNGKKVVRDTSPGIGGSHGAQHQFVIDIRDSSHPITAGLPAMWMHAQDELYDRLRGPAENLTVLASAFSHPASRGSGQEEPMLMAIAYGKGRVFHTVLGDNVGSMRCVGFITTLQRGTEWAATGKVTVAVPKDFPTAEKVATRDW